METVEEKEREFLGAKFTLVKWDKSTSNSQGHIMFRVILKAELSPKLLTERPDFIEYALPQLSNISILAHPDLSTQMQDAVRETLEKKTELLETAMDANRQLAQALEERDEKIAELYKLLESFGIEG